MRPILLTAAAASVGMVPIAREVFWGPMAYAMIGGILAATFLTLVFLPALYGVWFRVKEPVREAAAEGEPGAARRHGMVPVLDRTAAFDFAEVRSLACGQAF
jgi:hypothetical protein